MGPRARRAVVCPRCGDRPARSTHVRRDELWRRDQGRSSAGRYGREGQGGPPAGDEPRRVWCWDSPFPLVAEVWMTVTSQTAVRTISLGTEPSASPSVAPRPRLPTTIRVARFGPARSEER